MSSEYAVQFVPEEHAPDPVVSHGDPVLPGKIGIWLFLASEIMFFAAILGSYIIYRAGAPTFFAKNAETLNKLLAGINTVVLIFSSLTMALSVDAAQKGNSKKAMRCLGLTVLCAFGFLTIKYFEYKSKLQHYTFQVVTAVGGSTTSANVGRALPAGEGTSTAESAEGPSGAVHSAGSARPTAGSGEQLVLADEAPATQPATSPATTAPTSAAATAPSPATASERPAEDGRASAAATPKKTIMLYDGHLHKGESEWTFTGYVMPMDEKKPFDLHLITEADFVQARAKHVDDQKVESSAITNIADYGPWRNVFFSSYFTLTGVHGLHVIGGIIPLSILLLQSLRGKTFPRHTEYVGLYWHFVDLVWIFLFPLLYLI